MAQSATKKEIRLGLIGLSMGFYAVTYVREAASLSGVKVVAICDLGKPSEYIEACTGLTSENLAEELGVPVVSNLDDLFNKGVDAVIITSEIGEHADHVVASLEAGAHVFCAKPLTVWNSHMQRILKAAARSHRVVLPGQPARYDDGVQEVVRAVHSGKIGKPLLVRIFVQHEAMSQAWNRDAIRGGGAFSEFGYYCTDFAYWITKERPLEVFGYGENFLNPDMAFWDNVVMLAKLPSGTLVSMDLSATIKWQYPWFSIEVIGAKGIARMPGHNYASIIHKEETVLGTIRYAPMHLREIRHFIRCIRGEEQPLISLDDAKAAVEMLEALRESIISGEPVRLE
jgi:myo-inositol 2-dehydrogenase/D-chiro-inositol 1-dehydrogenase